MDNQYVLDHIKNYFEITDDKFDEWESLLWELSIKEQEDLGDSRWWKNVFNVVEVDGMYIGYCTAETTGDNSPADVGFVFEVSTIREVIKKEKTIVHEYYVDKHNVD